MLGQYKKAMYGTKEVECFCPYSLNELHITADANYEVDQLVEEIHKLFPLPTPSNLFFYDLIQDKEMIDSLNLEGSEYTLADLHAPSKFDLFNQELLKLKDIFSKAPIQLEKMGYSNYYLKALHQSLYSKHKKYTPGEFRKNITFIGGINIEQAIFISSPKDHLEANMVEMDLFMLREDISPFVRSAYLYYQIIVNRPFLIGNEIIARTISQLYLREFASLKHYIPLSKYLRRIDRRRDEAMRKSNINIFLVAFLKTLKAAIIDAREMILAFNKLKVSQKRKVDKSDHTIYQKRRLHEVLHQSFKTIYVASEPLEKRFDVQRKTIIKRYRFLKELGIIKTRETYFEKLYYNEGMLKIIDG